MGGDLVPKYPKREYSVPEPSSVMEKRRKMKIYELESRIIARGADIKNSEVEIQRCLKKASDIEHYLIPEFEIDKKMLELELLKEKQDQDAIDI